MVREIESRQCLSKIVDNGAGLVEIFKHADGICHFCESISPMVCVEQCEIWRTRNSFLEMNGTLVADDHVPNLFNAVKNRRRQWVMEALSEHPHSLRALQGYLKSKGYYHSQRTIAREYVDPLLEVGFVDADSGVYRLTLYGQKLLDVLRRFDVENPLPSHSRCYEEILLRELKNGPKSYAELSRLLAPTGLSRPLNRLLENGLVKKSKSRNYVFYFRTTKVPKEGFSPTEKRIYDAIPEIGTSARELSEKVGISIRRTYKYLKRLRRRRLVFTRRKARTYELTSAGIELADFIEQIIDLVSEAERASAFLLERSKQTSEASAPSHLELPPRSFE